MGLALKGPAAWAASGPGGSVLQRLADPQAVAWIQVAIGLGHEQCVCVFVRVRACVSAGGKPGGARRLAHSHVKERLCTIHAIQRCWVRASAWMLHAACCVLSVPCINGATPHAARRPQPPGSAFGGRRRPHWRLLSAAGCMASAARQWCLLHLAKGYSESKRTVLGGRSAARPERRARMRSAARALRLPGRSAVERDFVAVLSAEDAAGGTPQIAHAHALTHTRTEMQWRGARTP